MLTNAEKNTRIDWELRGQSAPTLPGSWWASLLSTVPSGGFPNGVEIIVGGVARQELTRALATFSGTQGAGSTTASSGTSGTSSNNADIVFAAAASAAVTGAVAVALWDDETGGNVRHWGYIVDSAGSPITRSWAEGDVVMVEAGALLFVIGG